MVTDGYRWLLMVTARLPQVTVGYRERSRKGMVLAVLPGPQLRLFHNGTSEARFRRGLVRVIGIEVLIEVKIGQNRSKWIVHM
jgi:hypothetical protein